MIVTDDIIKTRLSKQDARFLLTNIRVYSSKSFFSNDIESSYKKTIDHLNEMLQYIDDGSSGITKHILETRNIIRIHELYRSLNYIAKDYITHWNLAFNDQMKIKSELNYMKPNPKQDNKGYYVGSGNRHGKSIRVPSKKRKTAWKRFVKLFPSYNK